MPRPVTANDKVIAFNLNSGNHRSRGHPQCRPFDQELRKLSIKQIRQLNLPKAWIATKKAMTNE
jgi:hypothetical protein